MPFAEFQPSDAGFRANDQFLKNVDAVPSVMDRAVRRTALLQETEQRKERFVTERLVDDQQVQVNRLRLAQMEGEQAVRTAQNRANVAVADGQFQAATISANSLEENSKRLQAASAEIPTILAKI